MPFPSPMPESEKWKWSRSVVSDPQRLHGLQPSRLLRPWDLPGKSTGVGCHCLLLLRVRLPRWHSDKEYACQCTKPKRCGFDPWVRKIFPGGRNGSPLQCSCLESPTDRGAWWATVHGVTKLWTQLSTRSVAHILLDSCEVLGNFKLSVGCHLSH